MRFKSLSVFAVLLLVGSIDARPSNVEKPEAVEEESVKGVKDDPSWRPRESNVSSSAVQSDSRDKPLDGQRQLKDLQSMDQSLRTVATQLLNVSSPKDGVDDGFKTTKPDSLVPNVLLRRKPEVEAPSKPVNNQQNYEIKAKSDLDLVREINSEISSVQSMGVNFGRPTNSKFGYYESSHPGQAMAITEEELERELKTGSTRLITAHKNNPTTTGGISTWILLNSPTTTNKPPQDRNDNEDNQMNVQVRLQTKVTSPVNVFETTLDSDTKSVSTEGKTNLPESNTPMERISTMSKSTTPIQKRTTTTTRPTTPTTEKSSESTKILETSQSASSTSSSATTRNDVRVTGSKPVPVTKKPSNPNRASAKPKVTTPKPANITSKPMTTKFGRPNNALKPKTPSAKKPTPKPLLEIAKNSSTSKIEKVTFRPVHMITTPRSSIEGVVKPMFVTKIKTSLTADPNAKTTSAVQSVTMSTTVERTEEVKSNFTDGDLVEVSVKTKPQPAKTSNVLKVQLKKPTEPTTKIEIEPIKVNPPVLKIEKIEDTETTTTKKKVATKSSTPAILDYSQIDLKFDTNPELTKIDVDTSTIEAPSTTTTTKRPHKRKKNKVRRRKPTTAVPTSTTATSPSEPTSPLTTVTTSATTEDLENLENLTELAVADNSAQESKVVPETKLSANDTKNKKKQVQKPFGTQIYNFLSREVMPSFGVMSLVGLGLGLASYFLYPFSGAIARRNYVVEPNYKYNLDEYGGNYGQNEEEVFSKVLQGMTNNDGKYGGIKDYESNFYRYQQFDGAYSSPHATRKADPRFPTSSATAYRPLDSTAHDNKYRNTEFKYPELPTTPSYYDSRKHDLVPKKSGLVDRRFVVGNVPKEYGFADKTSASPTTQISSTEFDRAIAQNHKFADNPTNVPPPYGQPEAQALKGNEAYEEIEITPSAVAVEHGPRALGSEDNARSRRKRESVIQFIPSRTEIEKEEEEIEKEEPLSNEILDIIDSVIPENMMGVVPIGHSKHEVGHKKEEAKDDKKMASVDGDRVEQVGEKETESSEASVAQAAAEATIKSTVVQDEASSKTPEEVPVTSSSTTTTTVGSLTIEEILSTTDSKDSNNGWTASTTKKPVEEPTGVFNFVKKLAGVKLRLGIAILKHASEGFARYLGHVQKRVNGEE